MDNTRMFVSAPLQKQILKNTGLKEVRSILITDSSTFLWPSKLLEHRSIWHRVVPSTSRTPQNELLKSQPQSPTLPQATCDWLQSTFVDWLA